MSARNGRLSLPITFFNNFAVASSLLRWAEGCYLGPGAKAVESAVRSQTQCALLHLTNIIIILIIIIKYSSRSALKSMLFILNIAS